MEINIKEGEVVPITSDMMFKAQDLTITLPNTISAKSNQVFNTARIGTITFESGTKTIYEGICNGTDNLIDNIILPSGVEVIESYAIDSDEGGMTAITIPSSVTKIEARAISGQNLTTIVNKTGRKFDWNAIITGTSGTEFETGSVEYNGRTITITNKESD